MKQKQFLKILLLLNFIFIFLTKAFSQNYIPFPDSSANWNVTWTDADCNINNLQDGVYSYYINGDTIINSTAYHKIFRSGLCAQCCPSPYSGSLNGYMGGLKNDLINKKVLLIHPSSNTDEILYNFDLNIGDTLKGRLASGRPIIISIDSVLINSNYHHRYNFSGGGIMGAIIEGIGSTLGLLEPFQTFEGGGVLNCMQYNNIIYYSDTMGSCNIIDFVPENRIDKNRFTLIRSDEKINIHFVNDFIFETNFSISVYDILGRQVFYSQTPVYDFSIFVKGSNIYILKITNGKNIKYQRG